MKGFVYLIQSGEFTKIGIAQDVRARMSNLQTGHPRPLELLGAVEVANCAKAEAELHGMFSAQRITGEWFDLSGLDVKEILAWLEDRPKPGTADANKNISDYDQNGKRVEIDPALANRFISLCYPICNRENWRGNNSDYTKLVAFFSQMSGSPLEGARNGWRWGDHVTRGQLVAWFERARRETA